MRKGLRSGVDRLASSEAGQEAALVALVIAPILAAAVHAVRDGWYPIGDDAYFSLRARDVLTDHHPWLGTWTSASQSAGVNFNNPGPLLFDVLAVPSRISLRLGPMIGTAALAAASAAGTVLVARRVAGWAAALTAAVGSLALTWAMGSSVVVEPWQPHSLLLPFLFFATCAWAMAAGRAWGTVGAVAAGSMVLQTHLAYVILVPITIVAATAMLVVRLRRSGQGWRREGRWLGVAALLGLVLWAQPAIEQVAGDGEGNLSRIAAAATGPSEEPAVGVGPAARMLSTLVSPWPEWGRAQFAEAFAPKDAAEGSRGPIEALGSVPSAAGAVGRLTGVAIIGAGAYVYTRRRHDADWGAALGVLAVLLTAGLLTLTVLPITQYGVAVHQVRWLWPVSIIATTWVGGALGGSRWPRWLRNCVVASAVALSAAAIVPHRQPVGPIVDDDAVPVMRALAPQLRAADIEGPLLLENEQLRTFEPYSVSVILELDGRGVEVVVDDPGLIRQLGGARAADGSERERLLVMQGAEPDLPAGGRVIAQVDGLTAAEERARLELVAEVGDRLDPGEIFLSERGQRALDDGQLTWLGVEPDILDLRTVGPSLRLAQAVLLGYLKDPDGGSRLDSWARLERRRDRGTVHVVVVPRDLSARADRPGD